jgi:hypothetical protein
MMNRRALLLPALLVAAACASSGGGAGIARPKMQIIARTSLANVTPTMASAIAVHYELQVTNVADVPVTLKRVDLDSMAGGGFEVASKTRLFDVTIPPGETRSVDFDTTAFVNDPLSFESRAPVAIRAQALFDSPKGKVQTSVQQRVSMYSGD